MCALCPHATMLVALVLLGLPSVATAQPEDIVGCILSGDFLYYGLHYGEGRRPIDNAPSGATDEVKGYTDARPSEMPAVIQAITLGFGRFNLNISHSTADVTVERRAHVKQTPPSYSVRGAGPTS